MGSHCASTLPWPLPEVSIRGAGQKDRSSGDENGATLAGASALTTAPSLLPIPQVECFLNMVHAGKTTVNRINVRQLEVRLTPCNGSNTPNNSFRWMGSYMKLIVAPSSKVFVFLKHSLITSPLKPGALILCLCDPALYHF